MPRSGGLGGADLGKMVSAGNHVDPAAELIRLWIFSKEAGAGNISRATEESLDLLHRLSRTGRGRCAACLSR